MYDKAVRRRRAVLAVLVALSLMCLAINLLSDLIYMWVDPRIDFETREV